MSKISEQRRNEILQAAYVEFSTHSIDGASMSEIAARAGIGKSTIYEYFTSKTELFTAVAKRKMEEFEEQVRLIFGREAPFLDQLRAYYEDTARWINELNLDTVMRMFVSNSISGLSAAFLEILRRAARVVEASIRRAQAAGELSCELDVPATAIYLLSLSNPFLVNRLRELGHDRPVELLMDLTVRGIQPPRSA